MNDAGTSLPWLSAPSIQSEPATCRTAQQRQHMKGTRPNWPLQHAAIANAHLCATHIPAPVVPAPLAPRFAQWHAPHHASVAISCSAPPSPSWQSGGKHHKGYPWALNESRQSGPTAQALHPSRLPTRVPGRPTTKSNWECMTCLQCLARQRALWEGALALQGASRKSWPPADAT